MASAFAYMLVGQLVVERPARAAVFERLGIDYCCGGRKPLVTLCAAMGLDIHAVCRDLAASDTVPARSDGGWTGKTLSALIDHIVNVHHARVRSERPRLRGLLERVAERHQAANPRLAKLRGAVEALLVELETHLEKEEQVLFPFCRQLESAGSEQAAVGRIDASILELIREHDNGAHNMERVRTLADDYNAPPQADQDYLMLLDGLRAMEEDLHRHIYEENNMLFPIALRAQQIVRGTTGNAT